jgi:hypothetical protein
MQVGPVGQRDLVTSSKRLAFYWAIQSLNAIIPDLQTQALHGAAAKLWTAGNCAVKGLFHPSRSP